MSSPFICLLSTGIFWIFLLRCHILVYSLVCFSLGVTALGWPKKVLALFHLSHFIFCFSLCRGLVVADVLPAWFHLFYIHLIITDFIHLFKKRIYTEFSNSADWFAKNVIRKISVSWITIISTLKRSCCWWGFQNKYDVGLRLSFLYVVGEKRLSLSIFSTFVTATDELRNSSFIFFFFFFSIHNNTLS